MPIPFQGPLYRLKPASFLVGFLGHEGPGSIHRYLHKRGLITSLCARTMYIGDGGSVLVMDISLTKNGFSRSQSFVSSIITTQFTQLQFIITRSLKLCGSILSS